MKSKLLGSVSLATMLSIQISNSEIPKVNPQPNPVGVVALRGWDAQWGSGITWNNGGKYLLFDGTSSGSQVDWTVKSLEDISYDVNLIVRQVPAGAAGQRIQLQIGSEVIEHTLEESGVANIDLGSITPGAGEHAASLKGLDAYSSQLMQLYRVVLTPSTIQRWWNPLEHRWETEKLPSMLGAQWNDGNGWFPTPPPLKDVDDARLDRKGYVIVTTEARKNGLNNLDAFVAHKESLGFTVYVVTENDYGTGHGVYAADNIRTWLHNNYQSKDLLYALMIGDPDPLRGDVPMALAKDTMSRFERQALVDAGEDHGNRGDPTDHYYVDLENANFDANGDGILFNGDYGQEGVGHSGHWDILVGRIMAPGENSNYGKLSDVDAILQKFIDYENQTDTSWRYRPDVNNTTWNLNAAMYEYAGVEHRLRAKIGYGHAPSDFVQWKNNYYLTNYDVGYIRTGGHGTVTWTEGGLSVGVARNYGNNVRPFLSEIGSCDACNVSAGNADRNLCGAQLRYGSIGVYAGTRPVSGLGNNNATGESFFRGARFTVYTQGQSMGYAHWQRMADGHSSVSGTNILWSMVGDPSIRVSNNGMRPTYPIIARPTQEVVYDWDGSSTVPSQEYDITNNTESSQTLSIATDSPWLSLDTTSAVLAPGEVLTITATATGAANLPEDHTAAHIYISEQGGYTTTRVFNFFKRTPQTDVFVDFDHVNGNTANTLGSSGGNLTVDSSAVVAGGISGNAYDTAIDTNGLSIPTNVVPSPKHSSMSVSFWINSADAISSNVKLLKGAVSGDDASNDLDLDITNNGTKLALDWKPCGMSGAIEWGDPYESNQTGDVSIIPGTWHLVTFVLEYGGTNKLFFDGQLLDSVEHSGLTYNFESLVLANGFNGMVDEFQTFNYALSDTEVQALYARNTVLPMAPAYDGVVAAGDVQFDWADVSGATSYELFVSANKSEVDDANSGLSTLWSGSASEVLQTVSEVGEVFWRVDAVMADTSRVQGATSSFHTEASSYAATTNQPPVVSQSIIDLGMIEMHEPFGPVDLTPYLSDPEGGELLVFDSSTVTGTFGPFGGAHLSGMTAHGSGLVYANVGVSAGDQQTLNLKVVDDRGQETFFDVTYHALGAPQFAGEASFQVAETAQVGSTVTSLSAVDPNAGDVVTYSLEGGDGAGHFSVESDGKVKVIAPLDYEVTSSYTLLVRASDQTGRFSEETYTVVVDNIAEVFEPSFATTFDENTIAETGFNLDVPNAGLASVTLDSSNDRLALATTGNTDMWVVREGAPIAWIPKPTSNTWAVEAEIEMDPTLDRQVAGLTVYEDLDNALPVFSFGLDYWVGGEGSIKLHGLGTNNPNIYVSAQSRSTVVLRMDVTEDFGENGLDRYTFAYDLLDGNGMQTLTTYDFAVDNSRVGLFLKTSNAGRTTYVNRFAEVAPKLQDVSAQVAENLPANSSVVSVEANAQNATYQIVDGNEEGLFAIDGNGLITSTQPFDFESNTGPYALTVSISDGAFSDIVNVTIDVVNVNEAPVASDVSGSIVEGGSAGQVVATVVASDPDAEDVLTYSIIAGNDSGLFAIDANGNVTTTSSLDYAVASNHVLTVEVSDGVASDNAQVTVNVLDVDDVSVFATVFNEADLAATGMSLDVPNSSVASITLDSVNDRLAITTTGNTNMWTTRKNAPIAYTAKPDSEVWSVEAEIEIDPTQNGQVVGIAVNADVDNAKPAFSFGLDYWAGGEGLIHLHGLGTNVPSISVSAQSNARVILRMDVTEDGGGAGVDLYAFSYDLLDGSGMQALTTYNFSVDNSRVGLFLKSGNSGRTAYVYRFELFEQSLVNLAPSVSDAVVSIAENGNVGENVVSVVASDPENDTLSYAITAGNEGGKFAIDSASGAITTTAAFDYEAANQYVLTVEVSDGEFTDTATVTVNVDNVNEAPSVADASATLAENGLNGEAVTSLVSSDPDAGASLSYQITGGNAVGLFAIDANGNITTTAALDFESASQHVLTVEVSDGELTDTATVTVDVSNVNEAPVATDVAGGVNENLAGGQVIGTVGVTDPDAGDSFGYTITAGNILGFFAVDTNGQVTTTSALDFETESGYALTVTVTDAGGLTDDAVVNVTVNNVNEAPSASDVSGSVAENGSAGAVIGTVATSDPEGDNLSYQITGGNGSGHFAIDANGQVTTTGALDHESASQHLLTVEVSDGTLTDTASVTVDVTDVNEAPSASDASGSVAENGSAGAVIGTVATSDPEGDNLTYQITGGNGSGHFAIDSNGLVTTTGALDFESASQHVLTVEVSDGTLTDTAQVTANVSNVNEAPEFASASMDLGAVLVGEAFSASLDGTATDVDSGDSLSYSKVSGPAWLSVAVDGSLSGTPASTDLDLNTWTVRVTDAGGLTADATITVQVQGLQAEWNLDETSGTAVADSSGNGNNGTLNGGSSWNTGRIGNGLVTDGISGDANFGDLPIEGAFTVSVWIKPNDVTENWAGIVSKWGTAGNTFWLGQHSGNGRVRFGVYPNGGELALDTPSAELSNGVWTNVTASYDGNFQKIYIDGVLVATSADRNAALPLRTGELVLGRVSTTNFIDATFDDVKLFNYALSDIEVAALASNAAPTVDDAIFNLAENGAANDAVGTVTANDVDGDTLSYQITAGNEAGLFAIDANGNITATAALDYEAASQYVLTVEVSDGELTDTATVTVNVDNVNEAPSVADASATLAENGSNGEAVTSLVSSDPENDALSYQITTGNAAGLFAIDANGNITTTAGLDFESASQHVLTVEVSDGELTDTAVVTIDVSNANEAPVASDLAGGVNENLAGGQVIGTVGVSDADAGDSFGYAITAGNGLGFFAIDTNGQVTTTSALDFETASGYALTVTVTDAGGLSDTAQVNVTVNNVNEAPTASNASGSVAENGSAGAVIGTVATSDPEGDNLSYQITGGNGSGHFAIDANGQVTTTGALDHEAASQHVLTVEVSDGELTDTAQVTVDVTDVNEAPTASNASGSVAENGSAGAVIGTVATSDPEGDSLTYQITGGNGSGHFAIDANGQVTTTGALDHEAASQHVLTVEVSDGEFTDTAQVTVDVTDVNEAPTASNTSGSVAENGSVGAVIGTVATSDPEGDSLTYQITGGNGSGHFAIDANGQVTTTGALDHEATSQHVLTVEVSDGELTDTAQVTVDVTDVNEAPTASNASGSVAENGSAGAVIGTVATSDPEGDSLTYQITGGNGSGHFAIDSNGQVTTTGALDHESASQHVLTVEVSDGELTDTAQVTANVSNVNEAPVANNTSGSVSEDASIGTTVASVAASDPDAGASLNYSITAGNTGNAFSIDSNGNVKVASALDYETTTQYTLTVQVSDGSLSDTAQVTVDVTDVVEVTVASIATGASSNITQDSADIAYSITDEGNEAPTVTVFYGETDGGQSAAAWDSSVNAGVQNAGSYVEQLVDLTEGTEYFYTVRAVNSAGEAWGSVSNFTTEADTSPKLVRTTVAAVSSTSWTTVDLGQNYNSAVVIATPIYADNTQAPIVTRIRNVNGSSFELKLDRADGLTDETTADVSVVAVEEGVYTLAEDGVQMEAVKFTSTVTAENNSWSSEARTMQNSYTAPVVVGQVMSYNDSNWSVFWTNGSSRTAIPTVSNFNAGKHVGEDPNAVRADETVGYIVIETGTGSINGVAYEAAVGSKSVRGFGNSPNPYTYTLNGNLVSASAAAISSAGMSGNNGAWAVLSGATPLEANSIDLHVSEDTLQDSETSHNTTNVGYIVFE